jgi:hypothetical protein
MGEYAIGQNASTTAGWKFQSDLGINREGSTEVKAHSRREQMRLRMGDSLEVEIDCGRVLRGLSNSDVKIERWSGWRCMSFPQALCTGAAKALEWKRGKAFEAQDPQVSMWRRDIGGI